MKILFISRAYPPIIGGIEDQNFGLSEALRRHADTTVIANTRGKKFLFFFLPYAFFRALFLLHRHDVVLLGDGVLAPLGFVLALFSPKKTIACVVHGLDITFILKKNFLAKIYRFINIPALKNLDLLITVGNQTITEALRVGISKKKCVFIPNGIDPERLTSQAKRSDLDTLLGCKTKNKKVILRVGRYVEHKGVEWFLRNVLPLLPEDILFVAAGGVVSSKKTGDSNFFPRCEKTIKELNLEHRAFLLTNLKRKDILTLFHTADIVVSPNIRVEGSMEGFGINAIEAGACGRVVIASELDGLKDAIHHHKNGLLVTPGKPDAFTKPLLEMLDDDERRKQLEKKAQTYVLEHFTWNIIAKRYLKELQKVRHH
jgi:glycosyltransferase involved in cell wall biosynthesis